MKLSSFLNPGGNVGQSSEAAFEVKEVEAARRRKSSVSGVQAIQAEKTIKLTLHIEEYDVILVEKMDDINCLALILNVNLIIFYLISL